MLIVIARFGLPDVGVYLPSFLVLFIVLVLAALAEELVWTGITAIDDGQVEAARSTGLVYLALL